MENYPDHIPTLSTGAIQAMINGHELDNVILQILDYKKIPGNGGDRYRLLLNDGLTLFPFAILARTMNQLIDNMSLEKFTVFLLKKYACNSMTEKRIIVCLEIEILVPGSVVKNKITYSTDNHSPDLNKPSTSRTHYYSTSPNSKADVTISVNIYNTKKPRHVTNLAEKFLMGQNSSAINLAQSSDLDRGKCITDVSNKPDKKNCPTLYPISSLTPYQQKWTIKARVTFKSSINKYSNSRGAGSLFSFNLLDNTGEIKAIAFGECVDKFYDVLKVNEVYYISNASVKIAKEGYASVKNDFEILITTDTNIALCHDNTSTVPTLEFNFIPIHQVESCSKDSFVDVIGVCNSVSEGEIITVRSTGKEISKREIQLVDQTAAVTVTLWHKDAENFNQSGTTVVAIKDAKVTNYKDVSLTTVSSASIIQINPKLKETCMLKEWYGKLSNYDFRTICGNSFSQLGCQNWKTIAEIHSEEPSLVAKTCYFTVKATVVLMHKENCMYQACPSENCYKKVVDMHNGLFKCDKCNREYNTFQWVLLVNANLVDFSGDLWVVAFRENAESLLGIQTKELSRVKETDEEKFCDILANVNFKTRLFKLRSTVEIYNDKSSLKTTVISVNPVIPNIYARKLLNDIQKIKRILEYN